MRDLNSDWGDGLREVVFSCLLTYSSYLDIGMFETSDLLKCTNELFDYNDGEALVVFSRYECYNEKFQLSSEAYYAILLCLCS